MHPITLTAVVDKDHRIVVNVPEDIPPGPVQVVIQPIREDKPAPHSLTREEARAKLLAAGLLVTDLKAPPDAVLLSDEEILELGRLPEGSRPSGELIDEDRGEY